MKYKIAICDDAPQELDAIAAIVESWGGRSGHTCEIRKFPSAEAFLFQYEEDRTYHILLLDVEMGEVSGIDLAKRIRRDRNRAEIIFITSHFEFAGEGYEVDALHYLVKPVEGEKLMSVLTKAAERLDREPPYIILNCEGETVKLYEEEILYVEAFLHYITIHTEEREYRIKENISAFAGKLGDMFYRVHRSYLVSLRHIVRISRTSVIIEGQKELPLARGKYDDINRSYIEHN